VTVMMGLVLLFEVLSYVEELLRSLNRILGNLSGNVFGGLSAAH
jgi:hypothetical protein